MSEVTRAAPVADSQSYDEAFFHDVLQRPSSATNATSGGTCDVKLAGPVRKTYMGDDLQKEVTSSTSPSLGCGAFESKNDVSDLLDDVSSSTVPIQEALGNDPNKAAAPTTAPLLTRTESYIYGRDDGLSTDTMDDMSDILNRGMIRGSSFTSMLSTTSSLSSMSMLSNLSPSMGSTWGVFSPRGEVKSRLPTPNPTQQQQQVTGVGNKEVERGRVKSIWNDEETCDEATPLDAMRGNPMELVSASATANTSTKNVGEGGEGIECSFSLSRQNSSGEIVKNHDSSIDDEDAGGGDASGNGDVDAVGEIDDCSVQNDGELAADTAVPRQLSRQVRSEKGPQYVSTAALHGLRVNTDGDGMEIMDVSGLSDVSGAALYQAPLSTNGSDAAAVFFGSSSPLSSTVSALNKGFYFGMGQDAEENDAVCYGVPGDDGALHDDNDDDEEQSQSSDKEGQDIDAIETSSDFDMDCVLPGHSDGLATSSPAPLDNFGGLRHTVDDPMATLLWNKASFHEEDGDA